jgi:hypothetical protein
MGTTTDHRIETLASVSLAVADGSVQGADVKSMPVSPNGLSRELLEEPAALAAEKVRGEGLRLMGEGGLLPELAQHLMQAALEAEMDEHLAAEAGRGGGRGSRSGGNMRNGYRAKKVMTEAGAVTVQVPGTGWAPSGPGCCPGTPAAPALERRGSETPHSSAARSKNWVVPEGSWQFSVICCATGPGVDTHPWRGPNLRRSARPPRGS